MKKVFVEPAMQRIELNLQENIAASTQTGMGYYFWTSLFGCHIMNTGKYVGEIVDENEAIDCLAPSGMRSVMMFYPREEVLPHFRR